MKTKSSVSVPFKCGDSVVYIAPDGSSMSATVSQVFPDCLYVEWYASYAQKHTACVLRVNWSKALVAFGSASFLALA